MSDRVESAYGLMQALNELKAQFDARQSELKTTVGEILDSKVPDELTELCQREVLRIYDPKLFGLHVFLKHDCAYHVGVVYGKGETVRDVGHDDYKFVEDPGKAKVVNKFDVTDAGGVLTFSELVLVYSRPAEMYNIALANLVFVNPQDTEQRVRAYRAFVERELPDATKSG